ncbi:hypothetical protein ID858_16705 [Xenorhabdus sp. DI]|uniref:hypothetical protein n=1 Tax=Xenorhabdus doucetiae TaxID=351671 RepID=UPI0019885D73|nr:MULTISPECIES: hypothetical protein [unclassified Xenorhabdus]MBD2786696.1 hypothetical protein [Xenorhabdus sp. 3]MBD2790133.1 hypothetical protein [Xenorhabdus sp. DI]
MKKIKVSEGYIHRFWSPLDGGPDVDQNLLKLNLNNLENINTIVVELLYDQFYEWPLSWQYRCKESLKYVIAYSSDKDLVRFYNSWSPQLGLPDVISVRDFYIYVWKVMFGEESYEAEDIDNYEIISRFDIFN